MVPSAVIVQSKTSCWCLLMVVLTCLWCVVQMSKQSDLPLMSITAGKRAAALRFVLHTKQQREAQIANSTDKPRC